MSYSKKKKKTLIIASFLGIVILSVGVFYLGRISKENKPLEPNNSQENEVSAKQIQKLKTELNSVKNELSRSNINQKIQLENKLSSIENKIKILANQDKSVIQQLEQELKEVKEKIKNDKPGDNPPPYTPPTDENKLKFTVYYFGKIGQNHMWCDCDTERGKVILIDKENLTFPNDELTKKARNYTITFLSQNTEKFQNQGHVYYFSKNNNKFVLEPANPQGKKEVKVWFSGKAWNENGEQTDYAFPRLLKDKPLTKSVLFYVNENHPRIKELLSQGKLQQKKQFIIRYEKVDKEHGEMFACDFNEFNKELEIIEV